MKMANINWNKMFDLWKSLISKLYVILRTLQSCNILTKMLDKEWREKAGTVKEIEGANSKR